MKEVDYVKCPHCGSEETENYDEWIYEFGYVKRYCDDCKGKYIVHFKTIATSITLIE